MIATHDIGHVAAERLLDRKWSGRSIRELYGPADLSFNEVAEILSEVFGRKIVFVKCDPLEGAGSHARQRDERERRRRDAGMYDAVEAGRLRPSKPRSTETTTPTTLAEFAREALLPLIAEPVAH